VPFFFMHFQMGMFRPDLSLKEKQRLASKYSPYGVLKELNIVRPPLCSRIIVPYPRINCITDVYEIAYEHGAMIHHSSKLQANKWI